MFWRFQTVFKFPSLVAAMNTSIHLSVSRNESWWPNGRDIFHWSESAYAPTLPNPMRKLRVRSMIVCPLRWRQSQQMNVLHGLGNFSARFGNDHEICSDFLGKHYV